MRQRNPKTYTGLAKRGIFEDKQSDGKQENPKMRVSNWRCHHQVLKFKYL